MNNNIQTKQDYINERNAFINELAGVFNIPTSSNKEVGASLNKLNTLLLRNEYYAERNKLLNKINFMLGGTVNNK